ncbi:hypothetical protein D3C85_464590 [compost metagenome]
MAATIGAVVLVLDDLYSAFTGGESIIGGWFKSLEESFPAIIGGFKDIIGVVGQTSSAIADDLMAGFKQVLAFVVDIFAAIIDTVTSTVKAIDKIIGGANPFKVLPEMFKEQFDIIFNLAGKYAGKLVDSFKDLFGMGEEGELPPAPKQEPARTNGQRGAQGSWGPTEQPAAQGQTGPAGSQSAPSQAAQAAPVPLKANVPASIVKGGSGGGVTQTNTNTFNINGTGNPAAVANEVVKRGGLGQTLQQSSPGLTGPTVG